MSHQIQMFDAFTGINSREKAAITEFLVAHTRNPSRTHINAAIDYALKNKPSFGGFILAIYQQEHLAGIVLANKTGMEGYFPAWVFVYVALDTQLQGYELIAQALMQKALSHIDGEVSIRIEPGHPALQAFKQLGFKSKTLELQFSKNEIKAALARI